MTAQRFLFRVDSATGIGSGHVMRCLTVAHGLAARGHHCHFVCRDLEGHIATKIAAAGFDLAMLPAPDAGFVPPADAPAHAHWAQIGWQQDAAQTAQVDQRLEPDWIVLDHYGFDGNWMRAASRRAVRRFVIDDLADRDHAADLLLDQGMDRTAAAYPSVSATGGQVLAGMRYALMKPEFAALRAASLSRRQDGITGQDGVTGRLLLALGGYDPDDVTSTILRCLFDMRPAAVRHIDVVLGMKAPHIDKVASLCKTAPVVTALHVDTPHMPELMAQADMAIGGAGLTAIERCVMGLPAIIVVQADNQIAQAAQLQSRGAALHYDPRNTAADAALPALITQLCQPPVRRALSKAAATICDGKGLDRVIAALEKTEVLAR